MAVGPAKNLRPVLVLGDPIVHELVHKLCAMLRLGVEIVDSPEVARVRCAGEAPLAVVCSSTILETDGIALARELHAQLPATTPVAVLFAPGDLPREPDAKGAHLVCARESADLIALLRSLGDLPRLVILDDDRYFGEILKQGLVQSFAITYVGTVDAVLDDLRANGPPDAILAELRLVSPDFHARLDALVSGLSRRTVFVTGGLVTEEAQAFLRTIPGRWIYKPFPIDALRSLIGGVLERPR